MNFSILIIISYYYYYYITRMRVWFLFLHLNVFKMKKKFLQISHFSAFFEQMKLTWRDVDFNSNLKEITKVHDRNSTELYQNFYETNEINKSKFRSILLETIFIDLNTF